MGVVIRMKQTGLWLMFLAGLVFTGLGLWIQIKAVAAQYLLQEAWNRTLADGQPHKPWTWAEHWPVARLSYAKYGVEQIVLSGDSGNVLAFAPGHNAHSGLPGREPSNKTIVISGHRDTHFAFLQAVQTGEKIVLETLDGRFEYVIKTMRVVDSDRTGIAIRQGDGQLLLVTCYPFDSPVAGGRMRYVVAAEPEDKQGTAVF